MAQRLGLAVAAVLGLSSSAGAFDVVGADFQIAITQGKTPIWYRTTTVPFVPDHACYYWWLQVTDKVDTVPFVETLHLPAPAVDWGDDTGELQISDDGLTVVRNDDDESPDGGGWFGGGWCLLDGDPIGRYSIDVEIDGELVHTFNYVVVQGNPEHKSPDQMAILQRKRD